MRTINVRGMEIGSGIPKAIVPVAFAAEEDILCAAAEIQKSEADIAEWRADYYEYAGDAKAVLRTLSKLRDALAEKPLIFTFRTKSEGGERHITDKDYAALCIAVSKGADADIIDVEAYRENAGEIIAAVRENGRFSIASFHDFNSTPPAEEIVSRLKGMQLMGADMAKIAVMPKDIKDVLILLEASAQFKEKYADRPFIAISMGVPGVVSRLACEAFGSSMTFGALDGESAPGQPPAGELIKTLKMLHALK